jgi:hypothetical protein
MDMKSLEISRNKMKKLMCTVYENTVMLRKRIIDPLIMANEEYYLNLPVKEEFSLLFRVKLVMRKLFGIGIDIVGDQELWFDPAEVEFEVFSDVPRCDLRTFSEVQFLRNLYEPEVGRTGLERN